MDYLQFIFADDGTIQLDFVALYFVYSLGSRPISGQQCFALSSNFVLASHCS
jgi:hypothetical protein